jgi:TatD DNase family protein
MEARVDTEPLLSLDAHAHFDPARRPDELGRAGAVLVMTLSLEEAASAVRRREPLIAWGVGCHPRMAKAQAAFDVELFETLAAKTALVGEIGLDARWSKVPMDDQLRVFRHALSVLARMPRIVSIHSFTATGLVLEELRRTPIPAPILHWWTGTAAETREAVGLGCYFSVHSAVARRSLFHTAVPRERILVESDHGWSDPPAAIPCRVEWVEHLLSVQLKCPREEVRRLAWRNLAAVVRETGTRGLLPTSLADLLDGRAAEAQDAGRLL